VIIDKEVYLEHYGVKGMKWGVRDNNRSGSSSKKPQRRRAQYAGQRQPSKKVGNPKLKKALKIGAITAASILIVSGGVVYSVAKTNSSTRSQATSAINNTLKNPTLWKEVSSF